MDAPAAAVPGRACFPVCYGGKESLWRSKPLDRERVRMITVDLAHRLSLIARNLEQAQTSLDSAFELLQTIIESSEVQSPAPRQLPQPETPPHPGGHLRKSDVNKRLHPIQPGERREGRAVHSWIIKQFLKRHSKPFRIEEVVQFAESLGYRADRGKILHTLHDMKQQLKPAVLQDSQGLWKAPPAKA
jgi:hypothetical protein